MSEIINKEISSKRPIASFPVRRMDFEFPNLPKYWSNNDPVFTHYFTALSTLFPEGEAFFVRSVRNLRKNIKNTHLDHEIGAFIGQEAMHSKEHHAFHQSARKYGLDPESLEKITGKTLKTIEKIFPKKWNLLLTVGIEHFTAALAVHMMAEIHKEINYEDVRHLWLWHSIEETEHKSVAFDLYTELYSRSFTSYIPRISMYTFGLLLVHGLTLVSHLTLLSRDKELFNVPSWKKFMKFGYQSYAVFIPKLLEFYRLDFHPNNSDESMLLELTKAKISLKS